jgi:hypothetical protein
MMSPLPSNFLFFSSFQIFSVFKTKSNPTLDNQRYQSNNNQATTSTAATTTTNSTLGEHQRVIQPQQHTNGVVLKPSQKDLESKYLLS